METTRLWDLAVLVRDAVAAEYAARSVDLPSRRFVSEGLVAFDCPQLAVQIERVAPTIGVPGEQASGAYDSTRLLRYAAFAVWVVREAAPWGNGTAEAPTPEQIEAAAQRVLQDPIIVLDAVRNAEKDGNLPSFHGLVVEDVLFVGPEGDYVGSVTRFALRLSLV